MRKSQRLQFRCASNVFPTTIAMPLRHFAGRAPVTPPTSDSESDSKSGSDVQAKRRAPVPRRRRFVARVVTEGKPEESKLPDPTPGKGFVPLKELQQHQAQRAAEISPLPHQRSQSPFPVAKPASSSSSSSESSESESEGPPSPPPEPAPLLSFKPVFVKPKAKDAPDTSRQESRARERKEEAQNLVSAVLEEEEASRRIERHVDLPDDTDYDEDKAREKALWRVREMKRVLRDREAEKAWQNRGMLAKMSDSTDRPSSERKDSSMMEKPSEPAGRENDSKRLGRAGPFFADRGPDGKFTEDIYNREHEEGRGGLSGLRVGRDGGRSGRAKFAGLAKEDTAGKLAQELKRDRELAAALEASRR